MDYKSENVTPRWHDMSRDSQDKINSHPSISYSKRDYWPSNILPSSSSSSSFYSLKKSWQTQLMTTI